MKNHMMKFLMVAGMGLWLAALIAGGCSADFTQPNQQLEVETEEDPDGVTTIGLPDPNPVVEWRSRAHVVNTKTGDFVNNIAVTVRAVGIGLAGGLQLEDPAIPGVPLPVEFVTQTNSLGIIEIDVLCSSAASTQGDGSCGIEYSLGTFTAPQIMTLTLEDLQT